jgi:hypothetical protein
MEPLYESNVNLVGWIEPGWHIWDTNMDWVAYISGGHAWSSGSGSWCGPVNETTCLDRSGQVVAWESGECPGRYGSSRKARTAGKARTARTARSTCSSGKTGPWSVSAHVPSVGGGRVAALDRLHDQDGIVVRLRAGPDLDHAQFGSGRAGSHLPGSSLGRPTQPCRARRPVRPAGTGRPLRPGRALRAGGAGGASRGPVDPLLVRGTVADAQLEVALGHELAGQFDTPDESGRCGLRVRCLRARLALCAGHGDNESQGEEDSQEEASGAGTRFDSPHGHGCFRARVCRESGHTCLSRRATGKRDAQAARKQTQEVLPQRGHSLRHHHGRG